MRPKSESPSRWCLLELPALLGVVGLLAGACGSQGAGAAPDAGASDNDDAAGLPTGDASAGDSASMDGEAMPPETYLRIAALSPDLPPIDVCVAPHGTTGFQGPLIGQLAESLWGDAGTDAATPGLVYPQLSAYVALVPGQYDLRIVAAGVTTCASALALPGSPDGGDASSLGMVVADTTNLPNLALNAYATLLIAGDAIPVGRDAPLGVTVISDDAVLSGAAAVLRAVNAVPSAPSLDFGLESPTAWLPLLVNAPFGAASAEAGPSDGMVDANGYLPIAPLPAGQALGARAALDASADTAAASNVEIDMGSIATLFAIGGKTGDALNPAALLVCIDNQPSGGLLSDCSLATP